ncbi:sensor histidine kinase [Clostridium sp. DL1XJH146]
MLLIILDVFTTLYQSLLLVWVCQETIPKDRKLTNTKKRLFFYVLAIDILIFTHIDLSILSSNLLMMFSVLIVAMFFYPKAIGIVELAMSTTYVLCAMISAIIISVFKSITFSFNVGLNSEIQLLLFVFIPVWILYFVIILFRKALFNGILYLRQYNNLTITIVLFNIGVIIIDTYRTNIQFEGVGLIFQVMIYCVGLLTLIFALMYFSKINSKSKEIEILNKSLNEKILELRKIKHDYGSEISSLYGLYKLNRMDKMEELFKEIIDRNQSFNTGVNVEIKASTLVQSIFNELVPNGIDIIVSDNGNYEDVTISTNDLLKIISNIIRNSVDALENTKNPLIKFNSYDGYNILNIIIINNGPKIPDEIKLKIFEAGFSTKETERDYRGYGLSIIKDILNKNNGNINIQSDENWTRFIIQIPKKIFN